MNQASEAGSFSQSAPTPCSATAPAVARFRAAGNANASVARVRELISHQSPALRARLSGVFEEFVTAVEVEQDQLMGELRQAKALAEQLSGSAPVAQQAFKTFCANALVINIHRAQDGKWVLGRALDDTPGDVERLRRELLTEYTRRSPEHAQALLDRFERTLSDSNITGDVVVLDGHKAGGRHFVLNTMPVVPPDILQRVYDHAVRVASLNGDAVHVPHTDVDPREALLATRKTSQLAAFAGA